MATQFKKGLKPYWSLTVNGIINMAKEIEEVSTEDHWGEENKMTKVNAPTIRELIITGADPKTIDRETYSESKIEEAIAKVNANKKAEKDFGSKDDVWGNVTSGSAEEDNEAW